MLSSELHRGRARRSSLPCLYCTALEWDSAKKSVSCLLSRVCTCLRTPPGKFYVGKANSLRSRVRSYFLESRWQDAKTGSLVREIADLQYIVVDNPREALALENNLMEQTSQNSMCCCATTKPIRTSSTRLTRHFRVFM